MFVCLFVVKFLFLRSGSSLDQSISRLDLELVRGLVSTPVGET